MNNLIFVTRVGPDVRLASVFQEIFSGLRKEVTVTSTLYEGQKVSRDDEASDFYASINVIPERKPTYEKLRTSKDSNDDSNIINQDS